jgi:teichuronic acid biosynthesis glycosyltransferase TuaC
VKVLWTTTETESGLVILSPLERALADGGVSVRTLRLAPIKGPRQLRRASRVVRSESEGFDVVHAQYGSACALASVLGSSAPVAITLRGSDWNPYSERLGGLMAKTHLSRLMSEIAIRRADLVICVSRRMLKQVGVRIGFHLVEFIPTPVDLSRLSRFDGDRARLRESIAPGLDPHAAWVLFSALNLQSPIKRFDLAVSAVSEARRSLGACIELVTASGVSWSRATLLASACDLVLSTSTAEGWPNCVKEGLALDIPFVATDTGDLASIAAEEPCCAVVDPCPIKLGRAIVQSILLTRGVRPLLRRHVEGMSMPLTQAAITAAYSRILDKARRSVKP